MKDNEDCPCGSGSTYVGCCQPMHTSDGRQAASAEALMRSRYSAYVLGLEAYLLATWHHSTRPQQVAVDADKRQWLGLKVIAHEATSPAQATVEFVARSRIPGQRADRLHELSRFVLDDGQWYYVDGQYPTASRQK